ncbi:MAG: hypothetical protein E6Q96_06215 [Cyclobacteriaceae bacterium]|nr:MAG: hypothetical protein E6Q96_06215 [Cyclobacteriaceae bacterium]
MELRDFLVTPILIILVYITAYVVRPYVTNELTRKYFFGGLTVRIAGALFLGILYQFYYSGGDTFNYHTHGSRVIWEAFMESPSDGLALIFSSGEDQQIAYKYSSQILFWGDSGSYFIVRLAAIFDLFTFSTYSATAILFALLNFTGMWLFFTVFAKQFPAQRKWIAVAVLFIPSVVFWGSGVLKDSVVLACIGILTYCVKKLFIDRRFSVSRIAMMLAAVIVIYNVKIYVLLCFLPAMLLWIYASEFYKIRSKVLKALLVPFVLALIVVSGFYAVVKIGEDDKRYALENLSRTARITAYDIGFYTGKNAGSGYSLGELDDSFTGMLKLAPAAVNVSLFRPYLWEVRNPLMALSAAESFVLFILTLYILFRKRSIFFRALGDPNVLFCLVLSVTFAFAVGVSTFNFGTLARYKIPLLPFYALALILIYYYQRPKPKEDELVAD